MYFPKIHFIITIKKIKNEYREFKSATAVNLHHAKSTLFDN